MLAFPNSLGSLQFNFSKIISVNFYKTYRSVCFFLTVLKFDRVNLKIFQCFYLVVYLFQKKFIKKPFRPNCLSSYCSFIDGKMSENRRTATKESRPIKK